MPAEAEIVLATRNAHKVSELTRILATTGVEVLSPVSFPIWGSTANVAVAEEPSLFAKEIAPLLQKKCVSCHNPQKRGGSPEGLASQEPSGS